MTEIVFNDGEENEFTVLRILYNYSNTAHRAANKLYYSNSPRTDIEDILSYLIEEDLIPDKANPSRFAGMVKFYIVHPEGPRWHS